ncbi:MAG: AEC family transporter [Candidatus Krumholzibacteriota bacterium]|nr:AEC family transporter [Candidatus Krumholzibacteriota bacterium]
MIITDIILPVFFVIALGVVLRLVGGVEERVFSRTQLYILTPALVFSAMARADVETGMVFHVLLFVGAVMGTILAVSQGAGFLMRRDRVERSALSIVSTFMNSGFYGIPLCMLAFGEKGFVYATLYVVCSSIFQSTVGIVVASAGRRSIAAAVRTMLGVPIIWSIVLSRVLVASDALPPGPMMKMIDLVGQAAIPIGLILLGMQLERLVTGMIRGMRAKAAAGAISGGADDCAAGAVEDTACPIGGREIADGLVAAFLRIGGGFAVALILLAFLEFEPILEKVLLVEASMPTAVNMVVYATEYDCKPRMVAFGVVASTLLSILSITLVLGYVGVGG